MATGMIAPDVDGRPSPRRSVLAVLLAFGAATLFVALSRWPVRRLEPLEYDEFEYVRTISQQWLPRAHTLYLASARVAAEVIDDPYRAFVVLNMLLSTLALVSVWWWLSALTRPTVAATGTLALGVGPVFWAYGAMAGNYTAIVLVGSFLLGVAARTRHDPKPWHPYAAAAALAIGTGFRQDIGTFWLPVFLAILWMHRWRRALLAAAVFTLVNLAWLVPMVHEAGGWVQYRAANAEFAYGSGYMNSLWHLGVIDAPVRYAVKAGMALLWTLGPGLAFAPRGLVRLAHRDDGRFLTPLLVASAIPALGAHLLVHFGVPGYAFHYVPALVALMALGIGRTVREGEPISADRAPLRLGLLAALLAAVFLFYPTDYGAEGVRGDFDMAFARHTRVALRSAPTNGRVPHTWRTANSRLTHEAPQDASTRSGRLGGN